MPLLLAIGLAFLSATRLFILPNGVVFDTLAARLPLEQQAVIVVRPSALEREAVQANLHAAGVRTINEDDRTSVPISTFGIERSFADRSGLARLIQLPAEVTAPEFSGAQVLSVPAVMPLLTGRTVVLGPPVSKRDARFTPSVYASPRSLDSTQLHARIMQAVASDRTATELAAPGRAIVLLFFALLLVSLQLVIGSRLRTGSNLVVLVAAWLAGVAALLIGGVLLPLPELTLLILGTPFATKAVASRERDRRLQLLADRAATFMRRSTLVSDGRRFIAFVPAMLRVAGVHSSVILENHDTNGWIPLAGESPETLMGHTITPAQALAADKKRPRPVRISNSASGAFLCLSRLDRAGCPTYCLFEVVPGHDTKPVLIGAARVLDHLARLARPATQRSRTGDPDAQLFAAMDRVASFAAELRRTIGALHTAAMLFDGSGVPLQLNSAMRRLLARAKVVEDTATPLDVAVALSGLDQQAALGLLTEALRHGASIGLASRHEIEGRYYDTRVTWTGGDLLFEAADVTDLQQLAHLRTEVASEVDARIRNDLEAIELASKLTGDGRLPSDKRARAMQMVSQAAGRTRDTLENLSRMISGSVHASSSEPFAVNPRTALMQALTAVRSQGGRHLGGVKLTVPQLASLVLADPGELDELLKAMLQVVTSDGEEDGEIRVTLTEGAEASVIVIAGGFGLPPDRFELALSDGAQGVPAPFRTLQRVRGYLGDWGAELKLVSEAGLGYRFELILRRAAK
ncbi:hypothetical protein E0504_10860 [Parafrankia sp. BMG5.11]|nr:hypothetical protein E0504_10860 [Parafrankia sp. BMG5.11]